MASDLFQGLPETFEMCPYWTLKSLPSEILMSLELESFQASSERFTPQHLAKPLCWRTWPRRKTCPSLPCPAMPCRALLYPVLHWIEAEKFCSSILCPSNLSLQVSLVEKQACAQCGIGSIWHSNEHNWPELPCNPEINVLAPRIFLFKNQMVPKGEFFSLKATHWCLHV